MFDRLKHVFLLVKSVFLSGLFTIIPIAATIFFINFLYGLVIKSIAPLRFLEPTILRTIPGAEFVCVMIIILCIGIVLKGFIINQVVHYFERLIGRIPLIRIVYSAAKMVVDFFKVPNAAVALKRQVVLIPYPRRGQYHLAFLLETAHDTYERIIPDSFRSHPGEEYVKVFMPNSPNPTSGYFFIMPKNDVIPTDISFEEAIKTLVSCGLITPESLSQTSQPASFHGTDNQ